MNLPIPRKLSLTGAQLGSPRESAMPSPRTRGPLTPGGIDGVLSGGDSWMARRRASEAGKALPTPRGDDGGGEQIKEEDETGADTSDNWRAKAPKTDDPAPAPKAPVDNQPVTNGGPASAVPAKPPGLPLDVAAIEWQYLDPQGNIQGSPSTFNRWSCARLEQILQDRSARTSCPSGTSKDILLWISA